MSAKTIVLISDLHCGSVFGLTPPEYWEADDARREMQKEAWNAYRKIVKKWHKPDFLCVNADCIDGSQAKMGGAELTTPDRNIQAEMAEECITMWDAGQTLMTYGSAYHVSSGAEDFEYNIAHRVKAQIGGRLNFEIEGVEFDMRHKVGSSGIPHGRATPLLREMMWNLIKESLEGHCVEGFTKVFCDKVELSTKMRDSISSVISCLITKDDSVRQSIKKLVAESDKRTFLVVLGKAGFVLYQVFLIVLGAAIANWFKSPK